MIEQLIAAYDLHSETQKYPCNDVLLNKYRM